MGEPTFFSRLTYDIWRRQLHTYGTLTKGGMVLECGIGPANLIGLMSEWFPKAKLFGLDIDYAAICQAKHPSENFHLLCASAETIPFSAQKFDFVLSLHMIEHLPRPDYFVWEVSRYCAPGGF